MTLYNYVFGRRNASEICIHKYIFIYLCIMYSFDEFYSVNIKISEVRVSIVIVYKIGTLTVWLQL